MLKKQVWFVLEDIKSRPSAFILNSLMLSAALLIVCYVFGVLTDFHLMKMKMQSVLSGREIFMFRDNTPDDKFNDILNQEKYLKKMQKLYDRVNDLAEKSSADLYLADSSMDFICSDQIKLPEKLQEINSGKQNHIPQLAVTKNFFSIYGLQGEDMQDGWQQEFRIRQGKPVPVILGDGLRTVFRLHEIIEDGKGRKYEVAGFLEKGSYYTAPDHSRKIVDLQNFLILPASMDKNDPVHIVQYFGSLYLLTDDKEIADSIVSYSRELDLFDFTLLNFSYQFQMIIKDTMDELFVIGTFLVLILVFAFVSVMGSMLQMLSDHRKEFAVHMMCGADRGKIFLRILLQLFLMIFSGIFLSGLVFGTGEAFVEMLFVAAGFMVLVLIRPFYVFRRWTIQTMLRRSYE